jgi:hypothetical protein
MSIHWRNYPPSKRVEIIKKHLTWISFTITCAIAMLVSLETLAAEGQPIVKVGKHCPSGYRVSGEYCVPRSGSTSTPAAIEKKGTCPSGYRKNGEYCVPRSGSTTTPNVIEKRGACPSGYKVSGKYCVERGK